MKKAKSLGCKAMCALMALALAGFALTPLPVGAAVREDNLLNEDFSGELSDNWVVNGGGDSVTVAPDPDEGVLKIRSAVQGNKSYVYLDGKDVTVPEDGSLIVEYDLVGIRDVDAAGKESVVNWTNFFGLMKGIQAVDGKLPAEITPLQISDTIVHTNPGFSKHAMATVTGRSMKAAVNAARPGYFGLTEDAVVRVNSMDSLYYHSNDTACVFRNAAGEPIYGAEDIGDPAPTTTQNIRFSYTFNPDGSASLEQRAVGAASDANAVIYTFPAGTFTQLDGKIGFFLDREGGNMTQVTIDNFMVAIESGANRNTIYESDFSGGGAQDGWKVSSDQSELANPPSILIFDNPAESEYLVSAPYISVSADPMAGRYYAKYTTALKISQLSRRSVGLMFGVDVDDDDATTQGVYTLAFSKNGDKILVALLKGNGTSAEEAVAPRELEADFTEFTELSISALCNNTVELKVGEQTLVFGSAESPVLFERRMGIAALGADSDSASAVFSFKNFKVDRVQSFASQGKDLYMNFDGKDENGNPWYNEEDYFIRQISSGVGADNGVYLEDGMLVFDNAGDTSAFIPQYRYTDFEMIFDLADICRKPVKDTATGKITRPVTNKFFICYNGLSRQFLYSANSLLMVNSPITEEWTADTETYKAAVADTALMSSIQGDGLETVTPSAMRHNILDEKYDGMTFRFRVVARGKTISVYYCLLGEEEYSANLYETPVYVGRNEAGFDGYVGISNTSFPDKMSASIKIDNFILRNTDSMVEFPTENKPTEENPGGTEDPGTSPPPSTEEPSEQPAKPNYGLIWGVVGGVLGAIALADVIVLVLIRRKKR